MRLKVKILLAASLFPASLTATNYYVGPSRQYTSLTQLRYVVSPGDTVFVDGDATYAGDIRFSEPGGSKQRIVIKGIIINGNRPVIDGGTNGISFIDGADHYTLESFEVRNASFRGVYHQSEDLILRDLVIHDCQNGIMGADGGSGNILLEYSEIHSCGGGDSHHQIYMATDELTHPGSTFRMQFCYIHDGIGGNNVKSRAERNEIYYNWIEGAYYHELELIGPDPAGDVPAELKREDSDVVGNVLWKRNTFSTIRIGGDATGESSGRYRFVNNTILMGDGAVFRMFDSLESVEMDNNIIIRIGSGSAPVIRTIEAQWKHGEQISGKNNYVETGLTTLPSQWTGTIRGSESIFFDIGSNILVPAAGSQVIDNGTSSPEPPPGYAFTSPLFLPMYLPPQHAPIAPGTGSARESDGSLDIGAYEYRDPGNIRMNPSASLGFILDQNFPNPFNPGTTIRFTVSRNCRGTLKVYNSLGQEVSALFDGEIKEGELYTVNFNASGLAGGVYFYRLQTPYESAVKKLILIK